VVSDAIPLITLADGVIVVSRLGKTLRDHAHRLRQQLDHLDAPTLGIVVNSAEEAQPYAYDYEYGEGYPPPPQETREPAPNWAPARGDRDSGAAASSRAENGIPTGVGRRHSERAAPRSHDLF
jgi:hypothetical protein